MNVKQPTRFDDKRMRSLKLLRAAHGGFLLHHLDVKVAVRLVARARQTSSEAALHRRIERRVVEVRDVVVVRGVQVVARQQDVDEVVRIGVVGDPALRRDVERLATGAFLVDLDGAGERVRVHVEADLLQVELKDLGRERSRATVRGVVLDVLAVLDARLRHPLLGGGDVRLLERVQSRVAEAGEARRQDLIGPLTGEVTALGEQRRAVDRVVDGLRERGAVRALEERAVMVEREVVDADLGLDPELALVDARTSEQPPRTTRAGCRRRRSRSHPAACAGTSRRGSYRRCS